jgi:hypothetical protein
VTDRFQDGRRRHVGNSCACYRMGNYHPILTKIGTQTKKRMLSYKNHRSGSVHQFQDGYRRLVGNSSACYKMGNYHPISMKIGTQTKTGMLSSKVTKSGSLRQKISKN